MNRSANVASIAGVKEFRQGLLKYQADARDALTMLSLELRRGLDWFENDRAKYWLAQARKASQALAQARSDLERKQLHLASEDAPSCYEEQKALQKAKRRLRLCEQKIEAVRRWVRVVRHEADELQGQLTKMGDFVDGDAPRAAAALMRMIEALEKYAAGASERGAAADPSTSSSEAAS